MEIRKVPIIGPVLSAALRATRWLFGSKSARRDTAIGEFGAGRLTDANAKDTKRSVGDRRKVE